MAASGTRRHQGGFFGSDSAVERGSTINDADLKTWSITPRLSVKNSIFGMPSEILTGIDYYDASYPFGPPRVQGRAAIHAYDLSQQSLAGYWQQTIGLLPTTTSPTGPAFRTPGSRREIATTRPRSTRSIPRQIRSTAAKRNTHCISASSIGSTTCSRCSAVPRTRFVRPMSMSASHRVPRFDACFDPIQNSS